MRRCTDPHRPTAQFTRALTTWLEPVLWFDLADHAPRDGQGRWTGAWLVPEVDESAVTRADAIRLMSAHPLGTHWLERLRAAPPASGHRTSWGLWRRGPAVVADLARALGEALTAEGFDTALSGSLSLYLQGPFRLSADIDLCLPDRLAESHLAVIDHCVRRVGGFVRTAKPSYVGGGFRTADLTVTLDIEAGSAYGGPIPDAAWGRRLTVAGIVCMDGADLVTAKRRAGRTKDVADLSYLNSRDHNGDDASLRDPSRLCRHRAEEPRGEL